MRLLLITPKIDPADDLFGHTYGWASALARRVERLYVIALWAGRPSLPANTRFASLGKGRTEDKLRWLLRLQRLVSGLVMAGRVDAVLAHMAPIFAVAVAPIARLGRLPLFLWYAHGHVSPMLRLAHRLVDGVGTSTPDGFRIPSRIVTITGQGIDTERFRPPTSPRPGPPPILSVGRFSPVKDVETLLDAYARVAATRDRPAPPLSIVGGVHSAAEAAYLATLRQRAGHLAIDDRVRFIDGVPYAEMPAVYREAGLFVTGSRTGSLDKAVLEAAASGLVPIVCNDAFRGLFGDEWDRLSFAPGDAAGLSSRLVYWLDRSPAERQATAQRLRERVERDHGVDHLADVIVAMIDARKRR